MGWFGRHLNWTFVLGCQVLPSVLLSPLYFSEDFSVDSFVLLGLAVVVSLWTEVWYLRQKGRSLWNLCWNLCNWIGFIVLLCLANEGLKTRVFEVWKKGGQVKTVNVDCDLRALQEVLSCSTCVFFNKHAEGSQAWCDFAEAPNIEGNYCGSFIKSLNVKG